MVGAIRAILDGLPALIGYWDADLRNQLANHAYIDYFGLTPEQIHGLHISEVLGEELYEKNLPFLQRALAGERQMFDREIPTPSGEKRYTQASYIPDVVDGTVRGIFVLVTDISQRRIAEIEAQEARLAAHAANRAKTEFLAGVTHELRTPLSCIIGFAALLRRAALPPAVVENLANIERAAWQLSGLVEDLLDSATLATGRMSLRPEAVRVQTVLEEAIALVRPLADERGIGLVTSPSEDAGEVFVWADPDRLKQVVLNLLSNAIKYGPRADVVTVAVERAGDAARITVADNGSPFTPEEASAIFEPMVRLGGADEMGAGLGLPLSRSLAEAMGGTLSVEAGAARGNAFVLTLAAGTAGAAEPSGPQPIPSGRALRLDVDLGRVLYAEGNLDNLGLVSAMLARFADVEVIPAALGHMVIDLARVHVPDAILLDLELPDIDGLELVRLLRSDERTRAIPIVAIGSGSSLPLAEDVAAAGAAAVLAKPFTIEDLFAALTEVTSGSRYS